MFLVSEKHPYVMKTERFPDDEYKRKYIRKTLYEYPLIRDYLGKENLPRQTVLKSEKQGQLSVLQEKVDLKKMTCLRNGNIDAFIKGKYGQQIAEALKDENNKKKMADFIQGAEKLFDEQNLMIDFIGANLFAQVDEQGRLHLKLVDYGCFTKKHERASNAIDGSQEFIDKLKQFIGL